MSVSLANIGNLAVARRLNNHQIAQLFVTPEVRATRGREVHIPKKGKKK